MKKKITKKVYKKQIKRKVKKRATAKKGIFFNIFNNIKGWFTGGMKRIRKEQRHCLRFKKNKGKQSFCFVKALLLKYPKRTMLGFATLSFIGLSIFIINFQQNIKWIQLGLSLQTSLISQLQDKINGLRSKIADRQKCTLNQYWKEPIADVCKDWLYQQENKHCAKFGVETTRVAIGTKICCNPLDTIVYDDPDANVTACPGSTIFFNDKKMFNATIVADESGCRPGVCQFYPSAGNVIKFDVHGKIAIGKQGQPMIVKPCAVERNVGACNKECGGGQRIVTGVDRYCNHFKMQELCNVEPCFMETIAN